MPDPDRLVHIVDDVPDLEDVSEDVRSRLEFTWASEVGEVLDAVLEESPAGDAAVTSETQG